MKNFILIISILFLLNFIVYSQIPSDYTQIPSDYPFKTLVDSLGNLYLTGTNNSDDILTSVIYPDGSSFDFISILNPGLDKGMDIIITTGINHVIYVTGFISEGNGTNNNIILIKYNSSGNIIWYRNFGQSYSDDKAYGITIDEDQNTYIAGYVTNKYKGKDFTTLKYDPDGNLVYQHQYNNPLYNSDDVATDILIDRGYFYAIGYTYDGPVFNNDIIMISYKLNNPDNKTISIHKTRQKETPTGFVITDIPTDYRIKSRTAVTGISDYPLFQNQSDYFTIQFDNNEFSTVRWAKLFNGSGNGSDVATSIAKDRQDNLYVTGFSYRSSSNPYDFATIKYNKDDGSYGWPSHVEYFDYNNQGGNDKATSVKARGDSIYIAGPSQYANNGFYIAKYTQIQGTIITVWDRVFEPSFSRWNSLSNMQTAAVIELDSLGFIYLITYVWNNTHSFYAVRKYDSQGNIVYTVDNNPEDYPPIGDNLNLTKGNEIKFTLFQNYPNPFNPVTKINYELPSNNHVTLKVYNMLGKEIIVLVNEVQDAGRHSIDFNAANLPSGIYYYKITSGSYEKIMKMILLK